jgi:hypothetical protein
MDREQLADIVPTLGVTIDAKYLSFGPRDGWGKEPMFNWTVTLKRWTATTMTLAYSMGAAHCEWMTWKEAVRAGCHNRRDYDDATKLPPLRGAFEKETMHTAEMRARYTRPTPPTLADVLGCLCADASGYDNARTFEEWAGDYGYDTDSRKAESTYRVVAEQAKQLRHLLGDDYARCLAAEW